MDQDFKVWNPRDYLEEISPEKARLSLGFLKAEVSRLFPKMIEHWKPLFVSLGIDQPLVSCELLAEKVSVLRTDGVNAVFEVNSWPGYIHVDPQSVTAIAQSFVGQDIQESDQLLVSYLLRRFLVTLEKTWAGNSEIRLTFADFIPANLNSFPAKIIFNINLNNKNAKIVFGITNQLVEVLNTVALENHRLTKHGNIDISVELLSFFVSTEMLIDYVRIGSQIKSEQVFSSVVNLYSNGSAWAQGVLKICQDKFVIELINFNVPKLEGSLGQTRISAELARLSLGDDFGLYQSAGAILNTEVSLNSPVTVLLRGEKVASALFGVNSKNFPVLRIISKT